MRARGRAFTLVELLTALTIAAVLFALALPSFASFINEQRLLNDARRVADAITLARSEALKRNGHVVLCATPPAVACGDADHWHDGWTMFADLDGNAEIDAGDAIIGLEGTAADGVTIVGNRPVQQYLRFNYAGQARMVSGALQMGTIEVCKPGLKGYLVVLANSGRTRIDRRSTTCP